MTETQHRVLSYIWKKGRTLRKEISRDLRIDLSTVTRTLKPLMDVGMVEVVGTVSSGSAGRRSEVISVNENWKRFLGISLQHGGITALLLNMVGEVLDEYVERVEINFENVFEILRKPIERFEDADVVSIGIPGLVRDGVVEYSAALGIENLDLRSWVEKNFAKKAFVVNDANAAAANFSDGVDNMVCFLISVPYDLEEEVGLGAGLWIDGSLYTGSRGFAGETGPGFKMGCSGTIEDLIAGEVKPSRDFEEKLAERMGILSLFLDPQMIVLSGDINIFPQESVSRMIEILKDIAGRYVNVNVDRDGERSVARGAFKALLSEMLSDPRTMESYLEVVR